MIIYIDLIFILNMILDLLLLITVKITLKRNIRFIRLLLGSFIGGLSIIFLFIPISSIILFIYKIIISIIMVLSTFGFKSLKYTINNLIYLYMTSTILGGFLYLLNIEYSYKQQGLIFINNGLSINFIFILISVPIFVLLYIKSNKNLKENYNLYYNVLINIDDRYINLTGYLDTGNKLKDPITNKKIIIVTKNKLMPIVHNRSPMYVPVKTINNSSLIKCYKPNQIIINKKVFKNYLVGIMEENINIDGVECILNNKMKEELYV